MRSYRIGIDARYLQRPGVGISRYLHQGVIELLEAGAHVTLITDDKHQVRVLRTAYSSADVVAVPGHSGFRWEQLQLPRHLTRAGYDAYIAPANYGLPLIYRGPTALILILHDLIPLRLWHIYLMPQPLWAIKYLLSLGIAAARANQIIAPSRATARDIARLLRRRNVSVAYPPIPHREANVPSTQAAALPAPLLDLHRRGVRRFFVYNGGADIRKNVPTLIRAFARLRLAVPNIDLVMIGSGNEHFLELIEKLGLGEYVHTLGYIDEPAKAAVLKSATALLYPSRIEGFGLPVLEAMAVGIPVICGTGGALMEIGGDAATYLDVITEESIAAAMATVIQDDVRQHAQTAGVSQLQALTTRRNGSTLASTVLLGLERKARSHRHLGVRKSSNGGSAECV